METDLKVRKVTQEVFKFMWFKQGKGFEEPSLELSFVPEITAKLMENLRLSIWIGSHPNSIVWKDYFAKHFERFSLSEYLFANYVGYACYLLNGGITDARASFVETLSLVTHFVFECWQYGTEKFLNVYVDLFCAFFEKELRTEFEAQGGWDTFNEYLESLKTLHMYNYIISANQDSCNVFKTLEKNYRRRIEPYEVNGVVIKRITEEQVENHLGAVSFADSVARKMQQLSCMKLEKILADFTKIDIQLEELYRQNVGEATEGIAIEEDPTSYQEVPREALGNDPSRLSPKKNQEKLINKSPAPIENMDPDSRVESQGIQEGCSRPKLSNVKEAQKLLNQILEDIPKVSQLLEFVLAKN